jgi:hypothetical protein
MLLYRRIGGRMTDLVERSEKMLDTAKSVEHYGV